MSPISVRQASCVKQLLRLFSQVLSDRTMVSEQNPVVLSNYCQPQPDLALLQPGDDYAARHPHPRIHY